MQAGQFALERVGEEKEGRFKEMKLTLGGTGAVKRSTVDDAIKEVQRELADRPQPESLENFDSTLAADTQNRALYAILASWGAILLYLWFRFGSWTFGLAAVLCLIHDLFFTLGLIALGAMVHATAFGQALLPFNPYWFEEPVAPPDVAGHAWLRERLPTPIATGENLYLTQGFEPLWTHRACDYAMPDVLRCGGLGQTRQICQAAARHGVVASPHNFSSGVGLAATLHLMASLPDTEWLEFDPTGTAVYQELFVEPLVVERGRVRVPQTPGLGVRLTQAVLNSTRNG